MARPIWSGTLSFGLLNVPVQLMPAEKRTDISFRMLDSRNNAPIRYERINAETGDEVPWKDIVKAFEYDKGNYVVIDKEDIRAAAPESHDAIEVEAFVDADAIGPASFEKPYALVPTRKAEKGYVLLREALADAHKIGVARIVIRSREHLAAVMSHGDALMLMMLRYPQELVDVDDYHMPSGKLSQYRVTAKEVEMARALIESMSSDFTPGDYRDEFRDRLHKVIEKRMKGKGAKTKIADTEETPENATTNVVDFMSLLEKSIDSKKRTPAKKSAARKSASKATKKTPAKRAAKTTKRRKKSA
jgi:DNA end-binding protein Ku